MWFKVDDHFTFNAKVVAAGNEAIGVWVRAGAWCAAQLTDGFLPDAMAIAIASDMANGVHAPLASVERLLEVGLWRRVEGGYEFHDWAEYQPSADEAKEKRKARSEAGRRGAEARWHGKRHSNTDDNSHSESDGKKMPRPVPSRPYINNVPDPLPMESADADEIFENWWANYPRKDGKGQARKAFRAALKKATIDELHAGLRRYADTVARSERKFIAMPATWLNGERWLDETTTETNGTLLLDSNTFDEWLMADPMDMQGWRGRWQEKFGDRR